jgi:hypothetical protein
LLDILLSLLKVRIWETGERELGGEVMYWGRGRENCVLVYRGCRRGMWERGEAGPTDLVLVNEKWKDWGLNEEGE